jgi:hypothetical protein
VEHSEKLTGISDGQAGQTRRNHDVKPTQL